MYAGPSIDIHSEFSDLIALEINPVHAAVVWRVYCVEVRLGYEMPEVPLVTIKLRIPTCKVTTSIVETIGHTADSKVEIWSRVQNERIPHHTRPYTSVTS